MRYTSKKPKAKRWPRRLTFVLLIGLSIVIAATAAVRVAYDKNLRPVSDSQQAQLVTVKEGSSLNEIADQLQKQGLIRSAWAFKLYVSSKQARADLQAGTYAFSPSQTVAQIVAKLTQGKIATNTVTILPAQRIDQIRAGLINDGFTPSNVDRALDPATYANNPALVDKPVGASLEGYLYPDSFQKTANTTAEQIISQSLSEMQGQLTPDIRAAFAKHGLSTYQGIILASIVEQEVSKQSDRNQVAQVFLSRLQQDMSLGSDSTARYGAIAAGKSPSLTYDSPYNTLIHKGLPPGPISNVSASSLRAVAYPSSTSWLYFVTGDDGTTYFSKTLDEHNAFTKQYCHKLCAAEQ